MATSPATFYDDNGVVRLQGQLDGGGGGVPDPFVVTGTDPATPVVRIVGAVAQAESFIHAETNTTQTVFTVSGPGGSGLTYAPNPSNNSELEFADNGEIRLTDAAGDEYLTYNSTALTKYLDLDPANGQATVLGGFLRLAASSEPADALFPFNGCFVLYVDGSDLKAKARIADAYVHATLGTFS